MWPIPKTDPAITVGQSHIRNIHMMRQIRKTDTMCIIRSEVSKVKSGDIYITFSTHIYPKILRPATVKNWIATATISTKVNRITSRARIGNRQSLSIPNTAFFEKNIIASQKSGRINLFNCFPGLSGVSSHIRIISQGRINVIISSKSIFSKHKTAQKCHQNNQPI